jgi:hypothetical protein
MKRSGKLMGLLLLLLIAGNGSLSAQRGMRGMTDSTRMNRTGMGKMNRMDLFIGPERMNGMRGNHMQVPMHGMRGMDRMAPMHRMGSQQMTGTMDINRMNQGAGPFRLMMESMPDVTEKQKKDMADLMQKQQAEMKKMKEEISARMKSMRENHRNQMMGILTPEQKKFIESKNGNDNKVPVKAK